MLSIFHDIYKIFTGNFQFTLYLILSYYNWFINLLIKMFYIIENSYFSFIIHKNKNMIETRNVWFYHVCFFFFTCILLHDFDRKSNHQIKNERWEMGFSWYFWVCIFKNFSLVFFNNWKELTKFVKILDFGHHFR